MPQNREVNVYGQDGNVKGQARLPEAFSESLRPDLVRKAVNVLHANARQPYGSDPYAGTRAVVKATRPGQGMSRVTRGVGTGIAGFTPNNVGGRRAHPPLVTKDWSEKINKKERAKALRAALAATAHADSVKERGHKFKDGLTLPVVVEQRVEGIAKTSDLLEVLNRLGVAADVQRAGDGTHQRAGRGKLRGRRMRTPRSILLVAPHGTAVCKAAANLPGVDVASPEQLNLDMVAPGGDTGRLLVITEQALQRLTEVLA